MESDRQTPKQGNWYSEFLNQFHRNRRPAGWYLKFNHVIKEEYYDFADIQDLIEEVLTKNFSSENIQIITNILERLNEITEYKLMLIEGSKNNILTAESLEKFKEEYLEFERDLFYF